MKKSLMKFVFHEKEVADVTFHAMVETGRVVLHTESSSGRDSNVDLIGQAFALTCAAPKEDGRAAAIVHHPDFLSSTALTSAIQKATNSASLVTTPQRYFFGERMRA